MRIPTPYGVGLSGRFAEEAPDREIGGMRLAAVRYGRSLFGTRAAGVVG
jgi:hypothetical protein